MAITNITFNELARMYPCDYMKRELQSTACIVTATATTFIITALITAGYTVPFQFYDTAFEAKIICWSISLGTAFVSFCIFSVYFRKQQRLNTKKLSKEEIAHIFIRCRDFEKKKSQILQKKIHRMSDNYETLQKNFKQSQINVQNFAFRVEQQEFAPSQEGLNQLNELAKSGNKTFKDKRENVQNFPSGQDFYEASKKGTAAHSMQDFFTFNSAI